MFMQRNVAYMLLIVMLGLVALGLVMLSSTSAMLAPSDTPGVYEKVYNKLGMQGVWLVLGGVACAFFALCDYQKCSSTRRGFSARRACCWRSALCPMWACGSTARRAGCAWPDGLTNPPSLRNWR